LSGEIDIAAAADVLARASSCLATSPARLEIDLDGVTFIDSSGLGALVQIQNLGLNQGTKVVLVRPSKSSRRMLELSGLDQVLQIG
jgi:anti-sigma B factor antagonist